MSSDKTSILVVDDAPDTLEVLERNLSHHGYRVYTATGVQAAIELLDEAPVDLVITDLKMPKISGLDLVRYVRENLPDAEVMMITGHATIDSAVEAVKRGAEEYLTKPFTDDELESAVRRALARLAERRAARGDPERDAASPEGIVGESPAMQRVFRAIEKSSRTDAGVLITGESGVGKELVARAIHARGARASAPFVPVNCGAIPESLFESEVFGHVKGAFTGAVESSDGYFQAARGGTLFLDEISELSPSLQVKLLRVLQDSEVYRVGSRRPEKVDVRILAATNRDIAPGTSNKFREDLYFRLSVIQIQVPPLRERDNDVILLATHFARKLAGASADGPACELTPEALGALKQYRWPGNVRELENLVHHLVVMSETSTIDVVDLPEIMRFQPKREPRLDRTLAEVEAEYFQKVLDSVDGNKTRAAKILGIDRKTLRERLKKIDRS